MDVDGDPAAIIMNRDGIPGFVQRDLNMIGIGIQVFVHRIIDNFPDEVMQSLGVGTTDVHRGANANRFEPFEHLDFACRGVFFGFPLDARRTHDAVCLWNPVA